MKVSTNYKMDFFVVYKLFRGSQSGEGGLKSSDSLCKNSLRFYFKLTNDLYFQRNGA